MDRPYSLSITLPPLAGIVLQREPEAIPAEQKHLADTPAEAEVEVLRSELAELRSQLKEDHETQEGADKPPTSGVAQTKSDDAEVAASPTTKGRKPKA